MRLVARSVGCAVLVLACGCSLLADLDALENGAAPDAATPQTDGGFDGARPPGPEAGVDAAAPADAGDAAPTITYRDVVLSDAPIAYWPLDEGAGALVAQDVVGTYDAEVTGVVAFGVPGIGGTALQMDDPGARLELGDVFDFEGTAPFAIEFWAKPKLEDVYNNVMFHRLGQDEGWVVYFGSDGHLQFEQTWPTGSRIGFSEGTHVYPSLTHVVVSYDGTKTSMYLDGVKLEKVFDQGDGGPRAYEADMFLGLAYTGTLDEIAIYDHGLGPARIQAHREAAAAGRP